MDTDLKQHGCKEAQIDSSIVAPFVSFLVAGMPLAVIWFDRTSVCGVLNIPVLQAHNSAKSVTRSCGQLRLSFRWHCGAACQRKPTQ